MKNEVIENCEGCGAGSSLTGEECTMECRLRESLEPAVYYDDEELDLYRGRSSDQYTEEETEEFRYVAETMFPYEVAAWVRSLELRGVALPDGVKDEVILLMESPDAREKTTN